MIIAPAATHDATAAVRSAIGQPQGPAAAFQHLLAGARQKVDGLNRKLIATTFLAPILQRMDDDPLRSDWLDGGFAAGAFKSRLNNHLADRIAQTTNFTLAESLNRQFDPWLSQQPGTRLERIAAMRIDTVG